MDKTTLNDLTDMLHDLDMTLYDLDRQVDSSSLRKQKE